MGPKVENCYSKYLGNKRCSWLHRGLVGEDCWGGSRTSWVPRSFLTKLAPLRGGCASLHQPVHLSRVPRGLEPDENEGPYNGCLRLIKSSIQKLASETKKRKENLFEQTDFSFKPRQPLSLHKAVKVATPFSGRYGETQRATVRTKGVHAQARIPGSTPPPCCLHQSPRICRSFLKVPTHPSP